MSAEGRRLTGILQIVLGSVGFGFLGLFGKWAFQAGLSIGELLSFRFALAALSLWVLFILFRPNLLKLSLQQIFISSVLGVLGYAVFATLYFTSIKGVTVALAALLLYTYPFWVSVINHFLFGEKMKSSEWACLVGALFGLMVLLWGQIEIRTWQAVFAGLASGITYAIYIVFSGRMQKNITPISSSVYVITAAAVALWLYHQPSLVVLKNLNQQQFLIIAGMALFATILPMTLVLASLQKLRSNDVSLLSMVEPVTASLAAMFLLGEELSLRQWIGASIVLTSLAISIVAHKKN